jgi:hypothetical protein
MASLWPFLALAFVVLSLSGQGSILQNSIMAENFSKF